MSGRKRGRPSKAEERLASRAPVKVSKAALWLRVASIHEAIMAHEFSWPFNQPVDPEQLNLPSYHIIVKHPMDLGTIKTKLYSGQYSSVAEYASDVRLVWQNCVAFNDKNSELSEMCIDVASFFEWLFVNQIIHCIVDADEDVKPTQLTLVQGSELPNMAKRLPALKDLRAPVERPANSAACGVCEKSGNLLCCDGPCLRSFHLSCLGLESFPEEEKWFCQDCASKSHLCFSCGERGADGVDVFPCSHVACGLSFHLACVSALPLTKRSRSTVGKHNFTCPQHACAVCQKAEATALLSQCLHCPDAFHIDCVPNESENFNEPESSFRVNCRSIICPKHARNTVDGAKLHDDAPFNEELPAVIEHDANPFSLQKALDHLVIVSPERQSVWMCPDSDEATEATTWRPSVAYFKQNLGPILLSRIHALQVPRST